jgi:thiamine kinase-like enzyme
VTAHDASPEARVRAALAAHPETRALASGRLEIVRGGLSNHAWFAGTNDGSRFVRLGGENAASLGVDRVAECRLLEAVADAGVAPRIVLCDPGSGLVVTERVPGRTWNRDDLCRTSNLERMAAILGSLHRLEPQAGWSRVDFPSQARRLEGLLAGHGVRDPELRARAVAAEAELADRRSAATACHNDLHHLNILDDGRRLWLVDWEYGGAGDPLYDYASLLCQHPEAGDGRGVLLAASGLEDAATLRHLAAARMLFDYVQWLWYRLWVAQEHAAPGEYAVRAEVIRSRILGMR